MPAGLDPETVGRLVDRHGSLEAAAEKAQRDPRFEQAFRAVVAAQWYSIGQKAENAAATAEFWRLVAAWHSLNDQAAKTADTPAPVAPASGPPLPNEKQLTRFTHAALEKAVKRYDRNETLGDNKHAMGVSSHNARRIERMIREGLLWLNDRGKLKVDDRVGMIGTRYVLRYWDGRRWADPAPAGLRRRG